MRIATILLLALGLTACGPSSEKSLLTKEQASTAEGPSSTEMSSTQTIPAYSSRLTRPAGGLIAGEEVTQTDGCWWSPSWSLREETMAQAGRRLLIARGESCAATVSGADVVWELAEDESFLGLHRDILVLNRGTAPDGRELIVVNLETREVLYDGPYQHDEVHVSGRIVIFHTPIDPPEGAVCAEDFEARGLAVGFEQVNGLDMNTGQLSPMRGISCSPRQ